MAQKSEPIIIHPNELHLHYGCLKGWNFIVWLSISGICPLLTGLSLWQQHMIQFSPSSLYPWALCFFTEPGGCDHTAVIAWEALLGASAGISLIAVTSKDREERKKTNQRLYLNSRHDSQKEKRVERAHRLLWCGFAYVSLKLLLFSTVQLKIAFNHFIYFILTFLVLS